MIIVGCDVGIRNLALCSLRVSSNEENGPGKIEHWHVLDVLGKNKNATKTSIEDCVTATLTALSNLPWWGELSEEDMVAIESQPCGRVATGNIKCKVISHAIQSFVLLHTKAKAVFVNPKTKVGAAILATYADESVDLTGDDNVKKRYKIHKAAAVSMVQTMVTDNMPDWAEWYTELKKKDDAADSYLLALVASKTKVKKGKKRKRKTKKL